MHYTHWLFKQSLKTIVVIDKADTIATDGLYLIFPGKHQSKIIVICRNKQLSYNNVLKDRISKQCDINERLNSTILEYILALI